MRRRSDGRRGWTSSSSMALKEEETEEVKLAHSFSALPNTRTAAGDEIWNASCPYRDGQTSAKSRSRFAKTELELGSKKINVKKRKHQPRDTITFRHRLLFSDGHVIEHKCMNAATQSKQKSRSSSPFSTIRAPWASPRKLPTLYASQHHLRTHRPASRNRTPKRR